MQQDDGSYRHENLAIVERVWLDEERGAFRWVRDRGLGLEPVMVSVFDGRRAAGRYGSGRGPRLIRYEGDPAVVARVAGWLPVDAARAYLRRGAVPEGWRIEEVDPGGGDDVFRLPGGAQARLWRQLDPLAARAIGGVYWLGREPPWGPPDFAGWLLHFERERRWAAVVVHPGACVLTQERRPGDPQIGFAAVRLGDGAAATIAAGRASRDGSFGVRPPQASGGLGFAGYHLALAGVGTHGLVVETERHLIIVTGSGVGADAATAIAPQLRLL